MARQQKCGDTPKKLQTGRQLTAARALLGWSQQELAQASATHPNTILGMERREAEPLTNSIRIICKVQEALERAGVVLLPADDDGDVGARLVRYTERTDGSDLS